jgi:outer membrane protein
VVAGAIEFSNFNNDGVSETGTSSRPNFTFALEPQRIPADLAELARLSGERTLYTLIDRAVIQSLSEDVGPRVRTMETTLGVDVVLISAGSTASSCLAALPKAAKAVYVPIIPSLSFKERTKLFGLLAERKIMALSMIGWRDVERRALAGLSPENPQALFLRMALNIHQVLSGVSTSLFPVLLNSNHRLRVNMRTAQRIGWSPDYDTLLSAELLGIEGLQKRDGDLTLEQAMAQAAEVNVDKRVAEARLLASY